MIFLILALVALGIAWYVMRSKREQEIAAVDDWTDEDYDRITLPSIHTDTCTFDVCEVDEDVEECDHCYCHTDE